MRWHALSKVNYIVLIPAYNPDEKLINFTKILRDNNVAVLVVNDGSKRECSSVFEEVEKLGCTLISHDINRGKGQALRTGIEKIMNMNEAGDSFDYIVTADCDGQHSYEAITDVMSEAEKSIDLPKGPAIILGGRFKDNKETIPLKSRIGNSFTRGVFKIATGTSIYDTQTGLRALPKKLFGELLKVKGDRYEYEMNVLLQISTWGVPYKEIPIQTIYFDNNAGSHFHPVRDSLLVLSQILKYVFSSLASVLFDYILFFVLTRFSSVFSVGLAYAVARLTSSVFNYLLNANIVFHKMSKYSAIKYFILSLSLTVIGSIVTGYVSSIIELPKLVYKIFIDIPMFFVSYYIQRKFVFRK